MRRAALGLLIGVLLLVGGCPGNSGGAAPSSPAAPTSAAPVSDLPITATPTEGVLVLFSRMGGIAGLNDDLTVLEDGRFLLVRNRPQLERSGRLTADELAQVRRDLDASGFDQLPLIQLGQGNDLFTYVVVYRDRRVMTQDGVIAPTLRPLVGTLSGIVDRHGA